MGIKHYIRPVYYGLKVDVMKSNLVHRGITEQDLIVGCYMRSGSTWLQNMLYEILVNELPDHDKMRIAMPMVGKQEDSTPVLFKNQGRIIKSHYTFQNPYKNSIYLVRDPRRVAISEFKFKQLYGRYNRSFEDFVKEFVSGTLHGKGRWDKHIKSWHDAKESNRSNMFILRYEDLRSNTIEILGDLLSHFNIEKSNEEIETVIQHNSINRMKNRERQSKQKEKYKRKDFSVVNEGKLGGWENEISESQNKMIIEAFHEVMSVYDYL